MNTENFHDFFNSPIVFRKKVLGPRWIWIGSLFSILATLLLQNSPNAQVPETVKRATAYSYIPKGYSLVPIDIINHESVNALIESSAVANLYSSNEQMKKSRLLVKKARILRAPLNPEQFGVLVPESFTDSLMSFGASFIVTLQKDEESHPILVAPKKSPKKTKIRAFKLTVGISKSSLVNKDKNENL